MAFVAPKIIGGVVAPSPVGELGFVEMTQALSLSSVAFEQVRNEKDVDSKTDRQIFLSVTQF